MAESSPQRHAGPGHPSADQKTVPSRLSGSRSWPDTPPSVKGFAKDAVPAFAGGLGRAHRVQAWMP
jgi:hypothetical protein